MEGFIEVCGHLIEVKSIKDLKVVQKEYIYRPVFEEIPAKNIFSSKKYLFQSMEPYAAITGETNGGFLWQTKKYECVNQAGREMCIELDDVPVLIHQADGHSSEVLKDDPSFGLLGKEKAIKIEYVQALVIQAKEEYIFYGNNIHLFSVGDEFNKVKQAVEAYRDGKNKKKPEKEEKLTQTETAQVKTKDQGPTIEVNTIMDTAEATHKTGTDYHLLLDYLSDEAFDFLVDAIYPLFHFRVLEKKDVRRIDIREILARIEEPENEDWEGKLGIKYYLYIMKQYIDEYLKCKEGSEAEDCKEKTLAVLNKVLDNESEETEESLISTAGVIFSAFVSMFRAWKNQFGDADERVISDIEYGLKKEDAGLIRELWEHTELIPSEVSEQGGLFGFMKSDDTKIRASRLFYLNNMIFLCRSLF